MVAPLLVRWFAVLAMRMVVSDGWCTVVMAMLALMVMVAVAVVFLFLQEVGVDVELGVEVEAAQVEHLGQRHLPEMHRLLGRTRVHVLEAVMQRVQILWRHQIGLAEKDLVGKARPGGALPGDRRAAAGRAWRPPGSGWSRAGSSRRSRRP
jgi:hypothetical protein